MHQKMARLTLLLISPINIISGSLIISVMPFIKKDFMHVDNIVFLSQMIFTLPFISIVLFAPLTCYLTDYFGKKKTLVATLFYIAFIGTLTGLLDNIYYILVARFFFGIGIAFLSTVFVTLIGDYYASKERNFFLGYQKSFTLLFGLIFILLGEKLASYSWKYSFFLYGLIFFAAIMSAKYIYEPSIMIKIQKEKTSYRDIVFDNKVLFLLSFLLGILLYMQPIQLPFLLHDIGLGDYVGLIVGCHFAVAILSSYIYGVLSLKMSNKTIFLFGSICKAISYGAFSFAHELEQFLMFSFFSGIGSGIIHIHLIKWLLDNLNENSRIKGLSLQVSCTNLGIFLSPIIFYPIVKSFGYQSSFLIGSALFITISFCAYMYFKDKNS